MVSDMLTMPPPLFYYTSRVLLRASYGYHFSLLDMVTFSIPSRPIFMCLGDGLLPPLNSSTVLFM